MPGRHAGALRYVSVGCGFLLSDWEVLTRLLGCGYRVESAALVDTLYGSRDTRATAALQQLADWVHGAQRGGPDASVVAYASLAAFGAAAANWCHVFVQMDASDIDGETALDLACRTLAPGGVYARLENHQRKGAFAGAWAKTEAGAMEPVDDFISNARAHVEAAREKRREADAAPLPQTATLDDLLARSGASLRRECDLRGIDATGAREGLARRLLDALGDGAAGPPSSKLARKLGRDIARAYG